MTMALPKNPSKYWRSKKFCMPKEYLFKKHVLLGFTSAQIAHMHERDLGIKVSERTVRDYLQAYGIYQYRRTKKPKPKPKPKKPYSREDAAKYLRDRAHAGKDLRKYLDSLSERYRLESLRRFFKNMGRKRLYKHLNNREKEAITFIIKNYEVSGTLADLVAPNRRIMIGWPRIEEIRKEQGLSVYRFCKISKIDRSTYHVVQKKVEAKSGYRKTVLKIARALNVPASEISKEIKE